MNQATLTKILVIRNDKLGDFTLSLPTFALLKHCLPLVTIHALVPEYTRPIADICPYIDATIIDPGASATKDEISLFRNTLRQQRYSAALTLYSTTRIGWILARANIPWRIAPATKIAQLFYNHRIPQRRSQSRKPEYEYNLDLARALMARVGTKCNFQPRAPYLHIDPDQNENLRQRFCNNHNIQKGKRLIFIHPGSGGSANNLRPAQYAALAQNLAKNIHHFIVLSAGPGEYQMAHTLSDQLRDCAHCVYESNQGLSDFAKHINFADVFISGSTGPLHVAGALNRPTVGFYTNRQSATALRWQTLSQDDRRLAFSPPITAEAEDMSKINLDEAAADIMAFLNRLY